MSDQYIIRNNNALHFVTFTVIDWVDLYTRERYSKQIIESLDYCRKEKGLNIHAYAIMSSHVHLIISSRNGEVQGDIIRDFKKFTTNSFIKLIKEPGESRREWLLKKFAYAAMRIKRNSKFKVWKDGYHGVELTSNEMIQERLDYIHNNPVESGVVWQPEHYKYSSAIDYYSNQKGLLEVELI